MNGRIFVFLALMAMLPFQAVAQEKSWDALASGHYILGYRLSSDGCNPPKSVFNVKKDMIDKRAAMALYQIIRFADGMEEPGDGSFYKKQFQLSSVPNDIGISRWNKSHYIIPLSITQMADNSSSDYKTNNPEGDLRSYFKSDLDPDAAKTVHELVALKIEQLDIFIKTKEYPDISAKTDKILSPLLNRYYVNVTSVENNDENCD